MSDRKKNINTDNSNLDKNSDFKISKLDLLEKFLCELKKENPDQNKIKKLATQSKTKYKENACEQIQGLIDKLN